MALIVPSTVAQGGRFKFSGASGVRSAEGSRPSSLLSGANVAPQAVSTIRTPAPEPGKFDNTVLGTVSGVADQAGKVAVYVQNTIDEAVAKEADNKLADQIRNVIMNPESGYLTTNGKGALDSRKATIEKLTKAQGNVSGILQNDMQRALFDRAARARINGALDRVDSHAMQQVKVYEQAESTARIQSTQIDAINAWGSWNEKDAEGKSHGSFNMHKNAMLGEISSYLEGQGFRPGTQAYNDAYKVTSTTELTKIHSNVIENMVSNNLTGQAIEYYKEAKDNGEIDPSAYDRIEGFVEAGGVRETSARLVASLSDLPFPDQIEKINAMFDADTINADTYDAAITRANNNQSIKNNIETLEQKDYTQRVNAWGLENPYGTVYDMPTELFAEMEQYEDVSRFQSFLNNQRSLQGEPTKDGHRWYIEAIEMSRNRDNLYINKDGYTLTQTEWEEEGEGKIFGGNPINFSVDFRPGNFTKTTGRNVFLDTDYELSRGDLGAAFTDELKNLQIAENNNDIEKTDSEDQFAEGMKIVKDKLVAIGWDMTPVPGDEDSKNILAFKSAYRQALIRKQKLKKDGPLTLQEIVDEGYFLLKQGTFINPKRLRGRYDDSLYNFQIPDEAKIVTRFSDIPEADRNEYKAILQEELGPKARVTGPMVERAYNDYLLDQGAR